MIYRSLVRTQFILVSFILMFGCGGSDDESSAEDEILVNTPSSEECECGEQNPVYTGRIVGALVEGINYRSVSQSGETDSSGLYQYKSEEQVAFSIAGIQLGQAAGAPTLDTLDVLDVGGTGAEKAINLFRLLLTLDDDSDSSNGIQLEELQRYYIGNRDLEFEQSPVHFSDDEEILQLIGLVKSGDNLVSAENALEYLTDQLSHAGQFTHEATSHIYLSVNVDASVTAPATRGSRVTTSGAQIGVPQFGPLNGFSSEKVTIHYPYDGHQEYLTDDNASAQDIANMFNEVSGVEASGGNYVTLSNLQNASGNLNLSLNGVLIAAGDFNMETVAENINSLSSDSLIGISAIETGNVVTIGSSLGEDISIGINHTGVSSDRIEVWGAAGVPAITLFGDALGNELIATVGGEVELTLGEDIYITSDGEGEKLFDEVIVPQQFVNNAFDPEEEGTYNHKTSVTILDSQSNPHDLEIYFVKESGINEWTAYVFVDGIDVGDPNDRLPPPQNTEPRRASFDLIFNVDGTLNEDESKPLRISYWNPVDEDGNPNGALRSWPRSDGSGFPIRLPAVSSNFEIFLTGSTQLGSSTDESAFEVKDVFQNGTSFK